MTVWYLPIEPYEERYTAQLRDWTLKRFIQRGVDHRVIVGGDSGSAEIRTGVALDAHGRTVWGLGQIAGLVICLRQGLVKSDDVIYMQDLYQPGYDAMLYVLEQQFPNHRQRPRIFTHNLAQTIDPDDFTHRWAWMRSYEHMVDQTATAVFYASMEHKRLADVAGFSATPIVVGLLHDRGEVMKLCPVPIVPIPERSKRIVYTSRFDREKQPHFFLNMVTPLRQFLGKDWEIAILTGSEKLRSTDPEAVPRAQQMHENGEITIYEGLPKAEYYALLADSRLQINTALQDWVSNTLLESSALGTPTLAPAYKGFPDALYNSQRQLFVPWSLDDAWQKAVALVMKPPYPEFIEMPSLYHHATLDRVIQAIAGDQSPVSEWHTVVKGQSD